MIKNNSFNKTIFVISLLMTIKIVVFSQPQTTQPVKITISAPEKKISINHMVTIGSGIGINFRIPDFYSGYGTLKSPDGTISYTGTFLNGLYQGTGVITLYNKDNNTKSTFSGTFFNGSLNGQGTSMSENGDVYEGGFIDGKRSGFGKVTFGKGGYYEGEFDNNKYIGWGQYQSVDGNLYCGFFFNSNWIAFDSNDQSVDIENCFWGFGIMKYSSGGTTYVGHWVNGKRNGYGELFDSDNNSIEKGYWENDKFQLGHEVYYTLLSQRTQIALFDSINRRIDLNLSNNLNWNQSASQNINPTDDNGGPRYYTSDGYPINGYQEFRGRLGGLYYNGIIINGLFNGPGYLQYYDPHVNNQGIREFGVVENSFGYFQDGNINGSSIQYGNVDNFFFCYVGGLVGSKREGIGKMILKTGEFYEGTFSDDYIKGNGTIYRLDGSVYIGEFDSDRESIFSYYANGFGMVSYQDNTVYIGTWLKGKKNGVGKLIDKNRNKTIEIGLWLDDNFIKPIDQLSADEKKQYGLSN